jgi:hypothetical protein
VGYSGWREQEGEDRPLTCRNGHPWAADRVSISWASCDCPLIRPGHRRGHVVVHCERAACLETWHTDPDTLIRVIMDQDRQPGVAADRDGSQAMAALDAAWTLLRQAPGHHSALLEPSHPSPAGIARFQSWIQGCVRALTEAQGLRAQIARSDEIAHVEEMATGMVGVVDTFQIYASMLERFRCADETASPSGPLAAAADDERVLLNCRAALRKSMQQVMAALRVDF